ncbi:putative disease resistance protein rga4 [Quercus suber]|uniref:Disease resistance protein rga4 n=1 Tax=Quercus suber TaxID=58331 RepID=A0AAW0KXZ5_QUESU
MAKSVKETLVVHTGWWRGRRDSLPSFPRLSDLDIWNCPQLTSFPLFPYLERLTLERCSLNLKQSLERMMINNKTSSGNLPSIASSSSSSTIVAPLSKLRYMELHEVEEALPEECLPNLISLRTLSLYNCPLPQSIRYLTALQHLTVWNSEVVDLSNDWDEMEWQGLRNLLSLVVVFLPKLVSLPMGLQYVSSLQILSISHCRNEEAKKSAHKNWDLIKAFGCCNCSTQQLTHWCHLLSFINFLDFIKFHLWIFNRVEVVMYLISHCVTESKLAKGNITRRIESDNHAVGISSLYRYAVASVPFYIKLPICCSTDNLMYHNLSSNLATIYKSQSTAFKVLRGVRFPLWLMLLTNLVQFKLYLCKNCQYLPSIAASSSSSLSSSSFTIVAPLSKLNYVYTEMEEALPKECL